MWTVLLVEDEGYVREAIRETLDWESHGFCVAGEAGTGKEALEAILEWKPDVVIADIVMPGMDGIELLKETRKAGIRSRFIMLTAMNQFDYARDALQYGAFNYLLKLSLSDEVLLENLARIREELLGELKEAGEALYPLYHRIWAEISGNRVPAHAAPIALPAAAVKFHSLRLSIAAVLSGADPALPHQAGIRTEKYLLVQSFCDGGQTTFFCWSFPDKAGQACDSGFCRPGEPAADGGLEQFAREWRKVLNQLNGSWYGIMELPVGEETALPPIGELEAALVRAFEERNAAKCAETAALIWESMKRMSFSHIDVKQLAVRLLHVLEMLAGRNAEEGADLYKDEAYVNAAMSHESLLAQVQQTIQEHIRRKQEEKVSYTDHPEVNRVIQYMLEHYRENMKVTDLAKLVAINVDYLSTIFGKKTGLTPIAYLRNIRIEQAKRLLIYSKLSVEEIASQTGFADDAYFIKTFKRMTGQTPSSFRRDNNK
ncbi:hypothetical protein B1748_35480 [Paenibacillus sp. MY03]|uniref:response regulator transcription factor n=1 Tax=Paenibacillus sp. MY03 TaxID=302980 RepID=UPI000B3C0D2C|nr:helix-turn-helix domain-containing protein [Paenibacillus sp. MY03]OUS67838.1 hypothetical protein B1748_35480 [Paenibacillus sp. MY03]